MRPVSDAFLAALTGSHNMAVRVRAVPAGQTGTSPTGGIELRLAGGGGDVQLDGTAAVRSTLEVEILAVDPDTGEDLWPAGSSNTLTPYGQTELFVERGIVFGGGSVEYVSLGYFRIDDVEQPDAPRGPIRISGSDRMISVVDAKLTAPQQYAATATYGDVVAALMTEAISGVTIEWDDAGVEGDAIGRSVLVESDRYAFLAELFTGLGKIAYFDHRGIMVIRTPPNPSVPVWAIARGREGVMVSASRSISRSGVYNGVVATGEAFDTDAPARGLAVDSNPDSPTLWGGPFGRVPREFSSPLLTTDNACRLAAATVLRRSLGLPYNVDVTAVPNPALEPYDPIAVGIEGAPRPVLPELLTADSFARTVVDGVGSGEDGDPWSVLAGADANFAVNGGVLKRTLGSNAAGFLLKSVAIGRPNVDQRMLVRVPNAALTASLVASLVCRYASAAEWYAAAIEFNVSGTVTLKLRDSSSIVTPVALNNWGAYTAGQWWSIRLRAGGAVLQFKAWPAADPEPNAWSFVYDTARLFGSAGNRFGMWWWRVGANSNTGPQWEVDNYQATSIPPAPILGGELHVLDSLSIPLSVDGSMRGTTREQTLVMIETS